MHVPISHAAAFTLKTTEGRLEPVETTELSMENVFSNYPQEPALENLRSEHIEQRPPALHTWIEGVGFSSAGLDDAVRQKLKDFAIRCGHIHIERIEIIGARSSFERSGEVRAEVAKQVLVEHGVDPNLVVAEEDRNSTGDSVKIKVYGTPTLLWFEQRADTAAKIDALWDKFLADYLKTPSQTVGNNPKDNL